MRKALFLLVFLFICLIPLVSASVTFGDPYIIVETPVGSQHPIQGYVNVSLTNANTATKLFIDIKKYENGTSPLKYVSIVSDEFLLSDVLENQNLTYTLSNGLNSGYILINIDLLDISLPDLGYPDDFNESKYFWNFEASLFYGTQKLDSRKENFTVEPLPVIIVYPLFGLPGKAIEFNASFSYSPAEDDLEKYEWDFGDGNKQTTTKESVKHTYTKEGDYSFVLKITDENGLVGWNRFTVRVSSAFTFEDKLQRKRDEITAFEKTLPADAFEKNLILSSINLNEIKTSLNLLETSYTSTLLILLLLPEAIRELELTNFENELELIEIPRKVYDSSILTSELFADPSAVNAQYVNSMSNEKVQVIEEMSDAIALWQDENVKIDLEAKVKSALYSTKSEPLFSIVKVSPSSSISKYYLILSLPGKILSYQGTYNKKEISQRVVGFTLNKGGQLVFAMESDNLLDITGFASPELSKLGVVSSVTCGNGICDLRETSNSCPEDCAKPNLLAIILIIAFIILAGAVVLFVWKRKPKGYPKHLFKNKRDCENILSFVRKNLPKKSRIEVKHMLLKAGWKPEQIEYAVAKVEYERPVFKISKPGIAEKRPLYNSLQKKPKKPNKFLKILISPFKKPGTNFSEKDLKKEEEK